MEVLSEHQCQGWLEGYLLTGRHGLFYCYEAFIHIVDSMFNQHAKWLKVTREHPLAAADRLAQLPADLARLAAGPQRLHPPGPRLHRPRGQQEGRGRARLPAAGRQLPALGDRPLPAQPATTSTSSSPASSRRRSGWTWTRRSSTAPPASASGSGPATTAGGEPDVVMACAGDVPTLETLAAVDLLREHLPELKIRVVNVVDLMTPAAAERAPARPDRPRFRRAVHQRQAGHLRLPRLSLADPPPDLPADQPRQPPRARLQGGGHHHHAVRHGGAERPRPLPPGRRRDRPPAPARRRAAAYVKQAIRDKLIEHRGYIAAHGEDMPEVATGAGHSPTEMESKGEL